MNTFFRTTISVCSILISTQLLAAPMLRVIDVRDSHTIIVDRNGVAAPVRLAQVVVAPDDEGAAIDYLRANVVSSWVLVETDGRGESYVYRSPDGLFVNGELARRAYAAGHTKMVYLGESNPGPQRGITKKPVKSTAVSIVPPAKPHRARTTPKGAHRIPRTPK